MILPVAILCGGLGTRLKPITERMPKSLIEVGGQPFIKHQLKFLKKNNIERVVLCGGYLGEMIRHVIGNEFQCGVGVEYSFDGPVPLGTGGALRKALPLLGEVFFVLYGDSYLDCDYAAVQSAFVRNNKPALMAVFRNENILGTSNVLFSNNTIVKYDKKNPTADMKHIDYGLGVFKSTVFKTLPKDEPFDLADVYKKLATRDELAGYEVNQRFYEIGSKEGLEETRRYLERLDNSDMN